MTPPARPCPAGQLVRAFGDPAAMAALYAEDIVWTLPPSLSFPEPIVGRAAVMAFNRRIWEEFYHPETVRIEILTEVGDEQASAVHFIYQAVMRKNGFAYSNHYMLFARNRGGLIHDVYEMLDTATARAAAAQDINQTSMAHIGQAKRM